MIFIKEFYFIIATLLFAAVLSSCKKSGSNIDLKNLPIHTLVYGGDATLARNINIALFNDKARSKMMQEIKPILKHADIALVNAEGVIAEGGRFTHKGEPRPHMYRANPKMIGVLADAGIKVMTVGNNHAGDYGALAYREMLDRLTAAGIGYTGGGENLADAKIPYYKKVGDTVVAIVGGDITITGPLRALENRAGPLFFGMYMNSTAKESKELIAALTDILREARKHAHVVLFSPHWGDNWLKMPSAAVRTVAKKIIELGYDGIIGHSAHLFQGVEMVAGKPVIYDAGNFLLDYGGGDEAHRGFLWELAFNRAGITKITGHPLWMNENQTTLAKGKIQNEMLQEMKKRSKALGTELEIVDGTATADCSPDGIEGPANAPSPPARQKTKIRKAPSDLIVDKLPKDATPVDVRYDGGIRLVGYQTIVREHSIPKSGQFVILYWTADEPIKSDFNVYLEARLTDPDTGEVKTNIAPHWPGDWILPATIWPVGKIIKDWTLFRLTFLPPKGDVDFYAGLYRKELKEPESSSVELIDDKLVHIGHSSYQKSAKNIFEYLKEYEQGIGELGVYH